jgi:hypothetical protein
MAAKHLGEKKSLKFFRPAADATFTQCDNKSDCTKGYGSTVSIIGTTGITGRVDVESSH